MKKIYTNINNIKNLNERNKTSFSTGFQINFDFFLKRDQFVYSIFENRIQKVQIKNVFFYLNEIERIISFGTKHHILKYNIHLDPGIHFSLPDKKIFIYEEYLSEYLDAYKNSCNALSKIASKYNATILFENVKIESYTLKAIAIIANYDNLFFTLDLGHNIRYGNIAKEEFLKYKDKIKHVHLHDYNGSKDHQELFTGILDIKEELDFCNKHDLDVLIEVKRKDELINSINKLRTFGYI